jgi:hypothetical protein
MAAEIAFISVILFSMPGYKANLASYPELIGEKIRLQAAEMYIV